MKNLFSSKLKPYKDFENAKKYSDYLSDLSTSQILDIQLSKFKLVWKDCISDVYYYKKLVEQGKAPKQISSWNDFYSIPILDRATFKQNEDKFYRLSSPPDSSTSTGGSTSEPVKFGQWQEESDCLRVAKLVPWINLGYTPNDSLYLIWGHSHLLGSGWQRYWNHLIRKSKDWLLNYHRVDAYTLNKIKAGEIAKDIIQKKPFGIIGYAAVLDLLCRYTEDYHNQLSQLGVKFIMSCAEPPPRTDTFDLFHKTFDCPILQEFGGVDFGHVGFKINNEPYKLFPDLNILEAEENYFDNNASPAIVTTLYKRYVPLIRYRQGDLLTGVCRNNMDFVTSFENQIGRVNDMITLSDGNSIHSVALVHCFKDEKEIFNVQLMLSDDNIKFSLIVQDKLQDKIEQRIREKLSQISPLLKHATFNYCEDVSTTVAGKRRWIVDDRSK